MTRYQILIVDANLVDLVHEISVQTLLAVNAETRTQNRSPEIYGAVFNAYRGVLQKYVRGFHVCGCADHCGEETQPTRYSVNSQVYARAVEIGHSQRVCRYVLALEAPLEALMEEIETEVLHALSSHFRSTDELGPSIRKVVEEKLGRHIYYNPGCNRGEYLCEVGACTEFDPWETVADARPAWDSMR